MLVIKLKGMFRAMDLEIQLIALDLNLELNLPPWPFFLVPIFSYRGVARVISHDLYRPVSGRRAFVRMKVHIRSIASLD